MLFGSRSTVSTAASFNEGEVMFVLIDTREEAKAKVLNHDSIEDAESWAFSDLSEEEKDGCNTIREYQDSLGGSQWYHVVEAS